MQIINFDNIDYLAQGNLRQKAAYAALNENKILDSLKSYQPLLVGTIPINIDIPGSDLDIICHYKDEGNFELTLRKHFSSFPGFQISHSIINGLKTIICNFTIGTWPVEVFGQKLPTKQQNGYLHMIAEFRLLELYGETLRKKVIELKEQGFKTEPAFATVLGIDGNPYLELLKASIINIEY
ncbi:DUF4269 domain-containing protein [Mucilaginibacter sp. SMC90]|uniref:DUF4269 domain-containing protein n=1 Tax=Mucilaginibacter sp. SMC90 TaxID=2929803 RepID=UPI001FB2ED64|nr:DUF4269 domain-containing protein [Mucilaginibacter sp. SMC90]UOE47867.1 DUF4269 domain-containing protein [Mucilaginibacter sp. SMC90]